jgi:hypothetical protein
MVFLTICSFVSAVSFVSPWTPSIRQTASSNRVVSTMSTIVTFSSTPTWTVPVSGKLPDFSPDADFLAKSLFIDHVNATDDPCLIKEGCVSGLGMRKVLRFGTLVHNLGPGDAAVGKPPKTPFLPDSPPWFEWSVCHRHWHYISYADYKILSTNSPNSTVVATGHKNGFCLMDSIMPIDTSPKYDCENQGISAGSSDYYDANLACQWIDITDTPFSKTQTYFVMIQINPNRTFPETNYSNNIAIAPFRLDQLVEEFSGKLERPPDAAPPGTFGLRLAGQKKKTWQLPEGMYVAAVHGRHD